MFGAISGLISTGMQIAHQTMNWAVSSSAKILNSGKVTSHTITRVNLPTSYGPRLEDLRAQVSSYGGIIPKIYGSMCLGGNVIWAADIREEIVESENIDQGDHIITTSKTVEYNYFATLAIAICEGEITEIVRIWADDHLLSAEELGTEQGRFNIHLGSENQQPDLIIGKHKEAGTYPAYRGLCYVVIEDFPLAEYGNRIPSFSFEVRREIRAKPHVEEKIKDIVLIPGAGEFVYSDIVHYKQLFVKSERRALPIGGKEAINMHNFENKANMLVALDQMQKTLPNLEWVSVVVTWFATSTDAGKCLVVPKVEFHDNTSSITPIDWNVAGMRREQVYTVLKFADGSVTYGGTPSDDSVIAICRDLKRRGLKVMLYPMIFVDELKPSPKPWRGRIKARSAAEISNWFNNGANNNGGYNRFILHYANLTANYIDGIVIGSEMIGLTNFTSSPGSFPAVSEFIKLAAMVKQNVRGGTIVTYAADWSEYHHTDGGWFNLDPLWASPNIDVVGIDAYFPLTEDIEQTAITEDKIKLAWESGEGWDYYWNWERTAKTNFGSQSANEPYKYAWKNLEYWWKNVHTNPDGRRTAWRPKMKPVWFTEFGFPSVDGCTNQPNVFYDPTSSESYFPRGSRGRPDNYAQRQALNASLDYLEQRCRRSGNNNLVPRRFVWTWDGRPYPEWPRYKNVWSDGILWQTGHWVNGKLGLCGLAALIAELLRNAGYKSSEYDVSELTDEVKGFVIAEDISVREVIEQLQAAYFFDIIDSDGMLKFVSRMNKRPVATIDSEELVPEKSDDVSTCLRTTIVQELELPQKISLTHIDEDRSYNYSTIESQRQISDTKKSVHFTLPLVMNNQLAKRIADVTLYNSWQERISYELTVPPKYAYLEPGDVINVREDNLIHQMRITETTTNRFGLMKISAICFKANTYDFYCRTDYLAQEQHEAKEELATTIMEIIDGPPLKDDDDVPLLRLALLPDSNNWKGCIIYRSLTKDAGYKQLAKIENKSLKSKIGIVLTKLKKANPLLIDESSKVTVQMMMGQKLESITRDQLLTSATKNLALIGDELIQFERAEDKGQGKYELSGFIRGKNGTEQQTETHKKGERFVLLDKALTMKLEKELIGKTLYFKVVSIGSTLAATNPVKIKYTANNLKPFAPGNVQATREQNGDIKISWSRRSRISHGADEGGSWWDNVPLPDSESPERYEVDIIHNKNLIKTYTTTEPQLTYNKQQQTTDFGSYRKRHLTAIIYQMSNVAGRGYGGEVNV